MRSEVLIFRSGIKRYGISSSTPPHSEQIGALRIHEEYWPSSPSDMSMPEGIANYEIVIEATVSTRREAWDAKHQASGLGSKLDKAWVYVCGEPLNPVVMTLQFLDGPEGWTTNAPEIEETLARAANEPYGTTSQVESRHWMYMPIYPLKQSLEVTKALEIAPASLLGLVELHYGALKTLDSNGKLFLLAKGLELGSKFLSGNTKRARENSLPANIRPQLKRSLDWLFNVANNRFDIRHVVKDPRTLTLHPKLTGQERADFSYDANLIVRTIICQQLGRPMFNVRPDSSGKPPKWVES